jgi:glycosyltransferase involved in cell wall biosynthesis
MSDIKVSICCLAYNHESFIRQCLDGFVNQKCNFTFEVLIHDDASKDNTASVIKEYEAKYPDIIKPIYQIVNQYSIGVSPTIMYNFPRSKGNYIAICEGDDYWTDLLKLQKQVDFLEANQNFSICFTDYEVYDENIKKKYYPNLIKKYKFSSVFSRNQIIFSNFIPNCTVMFRNRKDVFSKLDLDLFPRDWFLHILNSEHGKIKFLPFVSSVYRKHYGGVCSASSTIVNNAKYLKSIKIFMKVFSKNYFVQFLFNLVILKILFQNFRFRVFKKRK